MMIALAICSTEQFYLILFINVILLLYYQAYALCYRTCENSFHSNRLLFLQISNLISLRWSLKHVKKLNENAIFIIFGRLFYLIHMVDTQ